MYMSAVTCPVNPVMVIYSHHCVNGVEVKFAGNSYAYIIRQLSK